MIRKKKEEEFIRFKEVSCPALNVRNNPSPKAIIKKVLAKGTIVECDKNYKDPVWDHIITDPDIEGYCMKQYLAALNPDTKAAFGNSPILIHTYNYKCASKEHKEELDNDSEEKED